MERTLETLQRYLSQHGRRASLQQLRERLGADASPDRVAASLAAFGLACRVVTVDARALKFLLPPILVFARSGEPFLVLGVRGRRLEVERLGDDATGEGPKALGAEQFEAISAGLAVQVEDSVLARSLRELALRVVIGSARPLGTVVLAAGAVSFGSLALPLGTRLVFDAAIPQANSSLLSLAGLAVLGVALHRASFGWIRDAASRFLYARSMETWLTTLFERVLRLPFRELVRYTSSERMQVLRSGEALLRTCTESTLVPILDAGLAVAFLVLLGWLLPQVAWVVAPLAALLCALVQLAAWHCATLSEQALRAEQREEQRLMDLIHGADTLKLAGAVGYQTRCWFECLAEARSRALVAERLPAVVAVLSAFVYGRLMPVGVLVWGGAELLSGSLGMGAFVAALQAVHGFGDSAARLGEASLRIWALRADLRRVRTAFTSEAESPGWVAFDTSADAIHVDNVCFRYGRDAKWALRGYSLRVRRGTVHQLSGASGWGKTTLLRLLAGLYVPDSGSVTIDGVDARDARTRIAYLPQDAGLIQGTIRENLSVLSGGAPDARVAAAAASTGLDLWLASWPMGYDTIVAAGGSNLSGGQRQLIALTACVASSRPIVLLDEAFAHIDPVTRERLDLERLFASEGRTVVSVTHEQARAHRAEPAQPAPMPGAAASARRPCEVSPVSGSRRALSTVASR